jgi:Domain of unknown function (DUF4375)
MYRYVPIDQFQLDEVEAHQLCENASGHYLAMAGNNFSNTDAVEAVPSNVRIVWCLWIFLSQIGGCGVHDYLWNHCFKLADVQEVHNALRAVDAIEMLDLLETGIRIAFDENCGEFLDDPGAREWAQKFEKKIDLDTEELDRRSWELADPVMTEIVARFIRLHRSEF